MAFNDPPGEMLHIVLSLLRARLVDIDRLVSVAGSMTALNLLTAVNPRRLHFFDMNPCAILWGKLLCELILLSSTPQEFISRLFARSVAEFECDAGQLTFRNQEKFLARPVSAAMREETRQALSDEAASVYSQILSGYQAPTSFAVFCNTSAHPVLGGGAYMHEHEAVAPPSSERRWGLGVSVSPSVESKHTSCGRMERCATVGTPRALCRAKIGGGCTTPRDLVWEARAVSRATRLDLCYWVAIADAKRSITESCCEPCRDLQMFLKRLMFVEPHPCPDDIRPTGHRGDGVASFHYGEGWLASSWLYAEVRRKLQQTQPTWSSQVDFPVLDGHVLLRIRQRLVI
ncbi:rnf217 [Symbiodinium sp. CCMP2592]|nr:rnf217 [Symbiodinium sp. CCMP2592]